METLKTILSRNFKQLSHDIFGNNNSKFARQLQMTPQAFKKYMDGERAPGTEILLKLYKIGVNINWLLTGDGHPSNSNLSYNNHVSEPMCTYSSSLEERLQSLENQIKELKAENYDLRKSVEAKNSTIVSIQKEFLDYKNSQSEIIGILDDRIDTLHITDSTLLSAVSKIRKYSQ
ncbi:MAG: hypothetical protein RBS48_04920 [Ignavibacteriaceae bacterium]|nr:hypothetical protein [Ignavibacteriaceae bacterium]